MVQKTVQCLLKINRWFGLSCCSFLLTKSNSSEGARLGYDSMMIRDVWMFADAAADAEMLQLQFWFYSLWVKKG